MEKIASSGASATGFFVIFTDLDGTLLDSESYRWDAASDAIDLCRRLMIPIVFVSSKTRAEMEILRKEVSKDDPFVSENGGGIFVPGNALQGVDQALFQASWGEGFWRWSLGTPYRILVSALREIRDELALNIRGFSDMSIEEISALTGLDRESCRLAALREYDEPFIMEDRTAGSMEVLAKAVKKRGLRVTEGGRFYHLHGENDKGRAVRKMVSLYSTRPGGVRTIGLGDSPNDFPMLEEVDYPVLIRSNRDYPELKSKIPFLRTTEEPGPAGWNSAVLAILGEKLEVGG